MLNDIKPPPPEPPDDSSGATPGGIARSGPLRTGPAMTPRNPLAHRAREPLRPHVDPNQPGLHKSRIMGEPTHIDPEYAMPMEDRGSAFSLGLSAVVVGVFGVLLLIVWVSFFR